MIPFLRLSLLALIGALVTLGSSVSAQDAYRVKPGDILRVEVIQDPDLNRTLLVSPDGRVAMPLAGAVQASGRTIEQIQATLTAQLTPSFASEPTVFVGVEKLADRLPVTRGAPAADPVVTIFVMGETTNSGRLELIPGTTLLQAFAQFGGFSNFAATKRIQLRRGEEIYAINYDAIVSGVSPNGNVSLMEGDIIIVPQRRLFE